MKFTIRHHGQIYTGTAGTAADMTYQVEEFCRFNGITGRALVLWADGVAQEVYP